MSPLACRLSIPAFLPAMLAALPGIAAAQEAGEGWVHQRASVRLGAENVGLPAGETMGLVGSTYLFELQPGLCAGPGVYGSATGQRGGLFVVGAEAALCTRIAGPLGLDAGLFVGGGGGGAAPVGSGLMLRPHVDLTWDFGGWQAGVSLSKVRFPSGQIDSNQFGLVFAVPTDFAYLPAGATSTAGAGAGSGGFGFDRVLLTGGAYFPPAGSVGNDGRTLGTIGLVGMRAERFWMPHLYGGIETNAAASGGAAGYAELLAEVGAELPLADDRVSLGARAALGMGGGGSIPVGGGLLTKAALDAEFRLTPALALGLEAGWAWAPQGSFSAPYGLVALRWDLTEDRTPGAPPVQQALGGGIETYHAAARKVGPPQSLQSVVFRIDRFVGDTAYLTGQVRSAYAGDAGAFAVGLFGVGAQAHPAAGWVLAAEMLAGAAGGGGVDTGSGAVVQPMVYAGVDVTRSLSLRAGAGWVKAFGGGLSSAALDLALVFAFGVGG